MIDILPAIKDGDFVDGKAASFDARGHNDPWMWKVVVYYALYKTSLQVFCVLLKQNLSLAKNIYWQHTWKHSIEKKSTISNKQSKIDDNLETTTSQQSRKYDKTCVY